MQEPRTMSEYISAISRATEPRGLLLEKLMDECGVTNTLSVPFEKYKECYEKNVRGKKMPEHIRFGLRSHRI